MEILAHWTHGLRDVSASTEEKEVINQQNHILYNYQDKIYIHSFESDCPYKSINIVDTPITHFIKDHTYEDKEFNTIDVFLSPKLDGEIIKRKL